ncbi:hypothetical protein BH20ACT7_BH20ACT7_16340 [soil metagenome]
MLPQQTPQKPVTMPTRVERNPLLTSELTHALVELWTTVSNAGGAVGFFPPVSTDDVRPTAEAAFARIQQGDDDLVVAFEGDRPVGLGMLVTQDSPLHRHWASIERLQRHPECGGRGVASHLLAELEQAARDRRLRRLVLAVRGGTGLEDFYLAHGYALDAALPERVMLEDGDVRDLLVLSKALGPGIAAGPRLLVRRLDPDLPVPAYAHPEDAGLDLYAREPVQLGPGRRALVPTGVAIALPAGHVGLVHPRSGLAARHGIALVNAPGTIDAGYRGEIKVVVINLDPAEPVALERGERIAQLIVQRVEHVAVVEVDALDATVRGEGGFGSSGRS